MTHARYAFIKAGWHSDIVDQSLVGFREGILQNQVDVFDVPGAFEIPLLARELAASGDYTAVIGSAFVVDGGTEAHISFFKEHFVEKGREAAQAALAVSRLRGRKAA